MRLFIAVSFNEEIKNKILDIINKFKVHTTRGRFVKREHLHLTIEFLGQVDESDIKKIKETMDKVTISPTHIKLDIIDSFKRRNGDIYWIGLEENEKLLNIRKQLYNILKDDFKLDKREYTPHLTIGRNVKLKRDSNIEIVLKDKEKLSIPVFCIDLIKSEQVEGKLSYKTVYTKNL